MNKIQLVFFVWLFGSLARLFSMNPDDNHEWLRLTKNEDGSSFTVTSVESPHPVGIHITSETVQNILNEEIYLASLLVKIKSRYLSQ
jgi:hypothetical protein